MTTIPKFKVFDHKRYKLVKAFCTVGEARQLAQGFRNKGKFARIWEKAGELHFFARFHVYSR